VLPTPIPVTRTVFAAEVGTVATAVFELDQAFGDAGVPEPVKEVVPIVQSNKVPEIVGAVFTVIVPEPVAGVQFE